MIYLFDVKKELIKVIPRRNIVSAIQELEINGLYTAEIEVPLFYKTEQGQIFNHKKSFDNALFFGHFDYHKKFQLYKIHNRKIDGKQLIITGVHLFFDEAKAMSVIRDKRLINADARKVANVAFEGTGWTVRDYDTTKEKNIDLYYMTPIDARKLIIEEYNVEFDYDFSFDGRKVTSKNIYIRNKLGRWTGDRYHYGTNILSITQEQDDAEVYTAAIGRGTSDDTNTALNAKVLFDDLTWSKDGYNKPLGQDYLEIVSATEKYGYYDEKTARIKPRIAIIEFSDIQDQKVLADKTWEWLKQNCVPKVTYSTTVSKVGEYYLGDEIAIIYKEIDIIKKARVENMRVNLLNHDLTELGLGDYTYFKQDKYRERISNEIKETKKEANSYIVKLKKEFDANFEEQTLSFAKAIEQVKINAQSEVESAEKRLSEEIDNELNALKQPNALPSSVLQIDELLINRLISDNMFANTLGSNYLFSEIIKTKSLEAVNANISNLRSNILTSNVIKAEHIDSGTALIDKLFSNSANIDVLTSKSVFAKNIQAIDIDLNRATVSGGDSTNYLTIKNQEILSRGIFTRTWGGVTDTPTATVGIKDGYILSKNLKTGYSLYMTEKGLSTMMSGGVGSEQAGALEFHYDLMNDNSRGVRLSSTYGVVFLHSENSRIYTRSRYTTNIESWESSIYLRPQVNSRTGVNEFSFYIKDNDSAGDTDGTILFGEIRDDKGLAGSGIRFRKKGIRGEAEGDYEPLVYATDNKGTVGTGSFYARNFYGNLQSRSGYLYLMANDRVRITDYKGYNNGNPRYADLQCLDIQSNSIRVNTGKDFYIGVSTNELRVTNNLFWNGGDTGYRPVRASDFLKASSIKFKKDVQEWNYDALTVIMEELQLYSYKYKDDDRGLLQHGAIIGDGYNTPVEFIFGEGINTNEMLSWALRSIQQLGQKIKILEDKFNESTTA